MTYKGKRNWRNLLKPRNPREKKKLGGMILSAVLALILVGFISLTGFLCPGKVHNSQDYVKRYGAHGVVPVL